VEGQISIRGSPSWVYSCLVSLGEVWLHLLDPSFKHSYVRGRYPFRLGECCGSSEPVVALLWVVSTVTSWFNFLTCIWIGVVFLHVVPFVYDTYEDVIDHHAKVAVDAVNVQYKKLDDAVLRKIPRAPAKEKKAL
jgi:hypothetical protein